MREHILRCTLMFIAVLPIGCQRETAPSSETKVTEENLQRLFERASTKKEYASERLLDSHGRGRRDREERYDSLEQMLKAGTKSIPLLLDKRNDPVPLVSETAWSGLKWIDSQLESPAKEIVPLLVSILRDDSDGPLANWAESTLRDIGAGESADTSFLKSLSDKSLRARVVLMLAEKQATTTNSFFGYLFSDLLSNTAVPEARRVAFGNLLSQVNGATLLRAEYNAYSQAFDVKSIALQLENGAPYGIVMGHLTKVAVGNSSVDGLDLGELTPSLAPVIPAMLKLAAGERPRFQAAAIKILGLSETDASQVVPLFLNALESPNYDVRAEAAAALGNMKASEPGVVAALVTCMDTEPETQEWYGLRLAAPETRGNLSPGILRRNIARALGQLAKDPHLSIPVLIQMLDMHYSRSGEFSDVAVESLGEFGPDAQMAVPILVRRLDQMGGLRNWSIARQLRRIDPSGGQVIGVLITDLSSENAATRAASCRSLAFIGKDSPKTIPSLQSVCEDSDPVVASWAAYSLWKLDPKQFPAGPAVPALISVLEENASPGRKALDALSDLGSMGPEAADAVKAITAFIEAGKAGPTGPEILAKIDPQAAFAAGLITAIARDQVPEDRRQSLGVLDPLFDRNLSHYLPSNKDLYDNLGHVTQLAFATQQLDDSSLEILSGFKTLQTLNLSYNDRISDIGLKFLSQLPALRELNLTGCGAITDAGLPHLMSVSTLESLRLKGTSVTLAGLKQFNSALPKVIDSTRLDVLRLYNLEKFHSGGLRAKLNDNLDLIDLTIPNRGSMTDVDQILAQTPNLERLDLIRCKGLTPEYFRSIAALSRLRILVLESTETNDESLGALSELVTLEDLNLNKCFQLSDTGIRHLSGLKNLRKLHLLSCRQVTAESNEVFASLPHLEFLNLGATSMNLQEKAALQTALPNCRFQF